MKSRGLIGCLALGLLVAFARPGSAQTIVWDGNLIFNNNPNGCNDAATGGFLENNVLFGAPFTHNRQLDPLLVNAGSLTAPDFRPTGASNALAANGFPVVTVPNDGFFQQTCYAGAFSTAAAENWAAGWTTSDVDGNPADFNLSKPLVALSGALATQTLVNTNNYIIQGRVSVPNGRTVTIQPGTVLFGSTTVTPSYFVVERGGKLIANGTASAPIIFTSERAPGSTAARGDWGGVVWQGRACANCANTAAGDSCQSEGGAGSYGGTDDSYNGGSLSYARIEFCGFLLSANNELNCLTMNALGTQTVIHHVQAHEGLDDMFEWFGGDVNCKYLYANGGDDDGLDFQMGYRGKVQFAVVQQTPLGLVDKGIEGDNNEFDFANPLCRSNPVFANLTMIGCRVTQGPATTFGNQGVHFRRGARGQVLNSIVTGFRTCGFDFDDAETVGGGFGPDGQAYDCADKGGAPVITWDGNVLFDNNPNGCNDAATGGFLETNVLFGAPFTHNRQVDPLLVNDASLTAPDFRPTAASNALCANFHPVITVPNDGFFEQTTYAGAMSPTDNWAAGWTTSDVDGNPADFNLSKPLVALSGALATQTLVNTNNYIIQGRVSVPNGRTVTIQPGTALFGSTTVTPSYFVVERGGRLICDGTANAPIIFTSERAPSSTAVRGDWGGVVWQGRACANCANTAAGDSCQSEGGAGSYGGTDDSYNGGSMSYTRIEFCGFLLSANNELNCLTMNALGTQTSIHHVQTHEGLDDMFEWFGGTVGCKYLYANGGDDDGLDFQMGYRGRVQFAVVQQTPLGLVDKGIEGDNNEFDFANPLCRSNPCFANLTMIGCRRTQGPATTFGNQGVHFRRGARGLVINSIIRGFRTCGFDFDDAETTAGGFGPNGITYCSGLSAVNDGNPGAGVPTFAVRAYPNPFSAASSISFKLPAERNAKVKIFNLNGQLVTTLVDGRLDAGQHDLNWSAPSDLSGGIYFYTVDAGEYQAKGKLVLVR